MRLFPHLHGAGGRDRRPLLVETGAGLFKGQPNKVDNPPRPRVDIGDRLLIGHVEKSARKGRPPGGHQPRIANEMARHLLLVVGMEIGVGEELLVA